MKFGEIAKKMQLETIFAEQEDFEISGGYTSDLLSDVMANAKAGHAFITIQAHKNTIAVADLAGISAIILANNRPVQEDMIEAAREAGVAIFRSPENQFVLSGKLYTLLQGGTV